MDVDGWLEQFHVIVAGELASPAAQSLVSFVERHAVDIASFVEARRTDRGELVLLDVRTGRPQGSVYQVNQIERIAVHFGVADETPFVYMLREDFPDTPHQQLTIEGMPRAICVDDRSWAEARLTWTPAEFVKRILSWFERAARGELHDAHQPLDPLMIGSPISFLISRNVLSRAADLDLIGDVDSDDRQTLRVTPVEQLTRQIEESDEPITLLAYRIPPEQMQRLTFAPHNLDSLAEMLSQRGIDLFADLRARVGVWLDTPDPPAWRINSRFAVIVEMPVVAPDGAYQDGVDLRAFITDQSAGAIAVALGIAAGATPGEGSQVGYVKLVAPEVEDSEAVRAIVAQPAEVHYEFDRTLAAQLVGRAVPDERHVVMVGAGAIGSHVADCLVREGRFRWTIIDDDRLLPHNLARHIGRSPDVTRDKAELVACALAKTIDCTEPIAKGISDNVMTEGPKRKDIDQVLGAADLVIDASASVAASRYLCDHGVTARRTSIFFNPAGDSAVLLAEPADRSVTSRDLEAQYLRLVLHEEALASHLAAPAGTFAYTGACRAITNQIPESRAAALSGLVAGGLTTAVDQDSALIRVWTMGEAGAVSVNETVPAPVHVFRSGDWTVAIDDALVESLYAMREACLPNETGGVLTGIVDIPAQRIHLVDAAPEPPDSVSSPSGFTRGRAGVRENLEDVNRKTRGQVRYVGEWHSHPPQAGTHPSATDLGQIDWLASLFDMDTLPALMLIAGSRGIGIILAHRTAEPISSEPVETAQSATGRSA